MEFKDVLKNLRKEKKISQQELANEIFVSRSAVAKWENGLGLPSEDSLELLMKYFNVDKDYFFPKIEPQVIIEKNILIRRKNNILKIAYPLLILLFMFFLFEFTIGNISVFKYKIRSEYVDEFLKVDGYYISVYENNIYHYYDSDGKECIRESSPKWIEDIKDSINWETQDCSGVVAYKRWGIFFNSNEINANLIYLNYLNNEKTKEAGMLYQIKANNGIYYYFYRRAIYYGHPLYFQHEYVVEVNDEKVELFKNYYFSSKFDLSDSNNKIKINDYELYPCLPVALE